MSRIPLIARAELTHILRSRLAAVGLLALVLLSLAAAATSFAQMEHERAARTAQQAATDALFKAQPDRHPHRMVHYGTYAHRPVGALAAFDPGVDSFTGTVVFLEGHRQNSPAFGAVREDSGLMRFGQLTPAFVLQVLAPLLLIFIGFTSVVRERETGALRQLRLHGARGGDILAGKALALASVAGTALLPALVALTTIALRAEGEAGAAILIAAGYAAYLLTWVGMIVAISASAQAGRGALVVLIGLWTFTAILAPRGAAELTGWLIPLPSRAETDLAIQAELRRIGDSHNVDDPFFRAFRDRLLAEHGVSRIEDLPFNYRGALSLEGEALTSRLFDETAARMAAIQRAQRAGITLAALTSPAIAVRRLSLTGAGTDLETHLRFLTQAEAHRYDLVQRLNRLHRDTLAFADDAARSRDHAAEQRTRISASHWSDMPEFSFQPTSAAERRAASLPALAVLGIWLTLATIAVTAAARRLEREEVP